MFVASSALAVPIGRPPSPPPHPPLCKSSNCIVNSMAQVDAAMQAVFAMAEADGYLTQSVAGTIASVYNSDPKSEGGMTYYVDINSAVIDVDLDASGGAIAFDPSIYGLTYSEIESDLAHELGHALTPDLLSNADLANQQYVNVVSEYGQNSAQAATAMVNYYDASQAADVIAASIAGPQNYIKALNSTYAIEGQNPNADEQTHGTEFDRIVAISQAFPQVVLDVPTDVTRTITALPVVVDGGKMEPIETASAQINEELQEEASSDDTINLNVDHGTDTVYSIDEHTTTDTTFINSPAGGDEDVDGEIVDETDKADALNSGTGDGDGDGY